MCLASQPRESTKAGAVPCYDCKEGQGEGQGPPRGRTGAMFGYAGARARKQPDVVVNQRGERMRLSDGENLV